MSETLLTLKLDKPNMLMSSSSKPDEEPILNFISSKQVFLLSSIGEGGMKVTSSCSRGLMVTVISGCGLWGHKMPFFSSFIGILVTRDGATLETSGDRLKYQTGLLGKDKNVKIKFENIYCQIGQEDKQTSPAIEELIIRMEK